MYAFTERGVLLRDPLSRREVLRIGAIGSLGLGGSSVFVPRALAGGDVGTGFGRAKSCILLFLMGGVPQHSTWDPKPEAPEQIRGEFGAIPTTTEGVYLSELLPLTARQMDKICVLRAVSTGDNAHSSSGYYMLTGRPHAPMNFENANPGPPNDAPSIGAVAGQFLPPLGGIPASVRLPHRIFNTDGSIWPGQDAGTLGRALDPWLLNGSFEQAGLSIREIELPDVLDVDRIERRRRLFDQLQGLAGSIASRPAAAIMDERARAAYDLLSAPKARDAFRLEQEPAAVRERYGDSPFGRSVLMGRRLVEAGVRFVQVNWYRGPDEPPQAPCWDSHEGEAKRLKTVLAPAFDRAYAGLIGDLHDRGLLDETLVVCLTEFGRTPRVEANGGRGHWGQVFSISLAGGGIRGGVVHGASDRVGGSPRDGLVRPEDITATIAHALGVPPDTEYRDALDRPHPISRGNPLTPLFS